MTQYKNYIEINQSVLAKLLVLGDVIKIEYEGKLIKAVVTGFVPCHINARIKEMAKNPKANQDLLKSSMCELESICMGSLEIIGLINHKWQEKTICLIDKFSQKIKLKPINCKNQKELETYHE